MFITYSPINPNKKICIDAIKNRPIIKGATPASNELQLKSFLNKKTMAINIEVKLETKPTKVINLKGTFECLTTPKIPKS